MFHRVRADEECEKVFLGVYSATSILGSAQNNGGRRPTVKIESFQIRATNQKNSEAM